MTEGKTMERYEIPKIEIIAFDGDDVISESDVLAPEIPADD